MSVTGVSGNDEDLLVLTPSQLGATTAGTWAMYFDGSDVGLTATGEDVDALDAGADGRLYLSTSGDLSVGTPAVSWRRRGRRRVHPGRTRTDHGVHVGADARFLGHVGRPGGLERRRRHCAALIQWAARCPRPGSRAAALVEDAHEGEEHDRRGGDVDAPAGQRVARVRPSQDEMEGGRPEQDEAGQVDATPDTPR